MSKQTHGEPPIVVDGSNIAFLEKTPEGKPMLRALLSVRDTLQEMGYRPVIIIDASLQHRIDEREEMEKLIEAGEINQAPADTDADVFVLKTACDLHARIVTDDQYRDHKKRFEGVGEKRAPVMIVNGLVEFYDLQPAGRAHSGAAC
jgi:hypothetical protein